MNNNCSNAAYITGIASFLPNAPVANEAIESVLGMIGGRPSRARRIVLRSNGIRQRYYAIDPETGQATHSNAGLAALAVRALGDIGDIDCLACGTTAGDQLLPGHGVMVHGELGIPACEVVSTAGICVSGVSALKYAYLAVLAGQAKNAVATASERVSAGLLAHNFEPEVAHRVAELERHPEIAFEKDFLRWMLSDGAGAIRLQNQPRAGGVSLRIEWIEILSQAHVMETCMYAGCDKKADGTIISWRDLPPVEWTNRSIFAVKQDVRLLNDHVIYQTFGKVLEKAMHDRDLRPDEVDWCLPHISSEYFRQPLADCMTTISFPVPQEKWFTNLQSKGNTGSASIYIMLDELLHSGRLRAGQRILCLIPESGRFTGSLIYLTVVADA